MEKRISIVEFRSIKNVAKACAPIAARRDTVRKHIEKLAEEYKSLDEQVRALESGIINVIGFRVEDLVKKVVEPTGATGKDGKPIKVTKYVPTDIVSYDEQKKQYIITIPDPTEETPATENQEIAEEPQTEQIEEATEETTEDFVF